MSKENDRCELRKDNLAIYTFVENGQYTFVFAEDGCVVPASCGDMPIFRVGNSLSQALSRLRMDKYPFFRAQHYMPYIVHVFSLLFFSLSLTKTLFPEFRI